MSRDNECPRCDGYGLLVDGVTELDDPEVPYYVYYTCSSCGFKGRKVYEINWLGHENEDGEQVEEA